MSEDQINAFTQDNLTSIQASINIEIESDNTVNYAMQQNDVPVVKNICITNNTDYALTNILVRITTEPDFAISKDVRITIINSGSAYNLGAVDLKLSHDYLAQLTERVNGIIHVDVFQGDESIISSAKDISVLAFDEWNGLQSLPEIIAAFVTPNHPAIDTILTDVSNILFVNTGDSSLSGYQSRDAKRVFQTTSAIYTALQQRKISYINPPASFEEQGQKIRLPDRILDNKLGTCLDLTVLFASCLEQIGLNPIIIFTENHSFLGVWLEDDCFVDVATDDLMKLRKRVELQEICVFETTLLTSDNYISFNQAVDTVQKRLADVDSFRCAIDICRSRKCRIRPLPFLSSLGIISERDSSSGNLNTPFRLPDFIPINMPYEKDESIIETPATRMDRWKRKLLDLSMRNKLINFRESKKTIPVLCPDLGLLEDALANGTTFRVYHRLNEKAEKDLRNAEVYLNRTGNDLLNEELLDELKAHRLHTDLTDTDLSRRMLEVYREAKLSIEENGANTLYLAIGFLSWYETKSSEKCRLAPIILIPLDIERKSVQDGFSISHSDDEPIVNITLLEMLAKDFELIIPNMEPIPSDEHGIDVKGILNTFRRSIKNVDRWEVIESAYIGHFSFTKFLMWRDLEVRSEDLQRNKVVSHLVNTPNQPYHDSEGFPEDKFLDDNYSPEETFCPLSSDSSQLSAIYAAAAGKSFVLHGPPGTGKSQTITNLIAHSLATGKTVLFVSEKRAALEVVHRRLFECGLDPFCLELHSNKSHKQQVLHQLQSSLNYLESERNDKWVNDAKRLANARAELNGYVKALHKIRESGESLFHGISKLIGLRKAKQLKLNLLSNRFLNSNQLDKLREIVEQLYVAANVIEHPSHNMWSTTNYLEWSPSLERNILEILQQVEMCCNNLDRQSALIHELLNLPSSNWTRQQYDVSESVVTNLLSVLPVIPPAFIQSTNYSQLTNTIREWINIGRNRDQLRVEVFTHFSDQVRFLDFSLINGEVKQAITSWLTPELIAKKDNTINENWIQWVEREVLSAMLQLSKEAYLLQEKAKNIVMFTGGIVIDNLPLSGFTILDKISELLMRVPPTLPVTLLIEQDWETIRHTIQSWTLHGRHRDKLRETLYKRYIEQLININLDELQQKMIEANGSWFLPRVFGQMSVRKTMKGISRKIDSELTAETLLADIEQAMALRTEEAFIANNKERASLLLGTYWNDGEADWDSIDQVVEWCSSLRSLIAMVSLSDAQKSMKVRTFLADFLRENRDRYIHGGDIYELLLSMKNIYNEFMKKFDNLKALLTIDIASIWEIESNTQIETIIYHIDNWQKQINALHQVHEVSLVDSLPNVESIIRYLELASYLVTVEQRIDSITPNAEDILGDYWCNSDANWNKIDELLEYGQLLHDDAKKLTDSKYEQMQMLLNKWANIAEKKEEYLSDNSKMKIDLIAYHESYVEFKLLLAKLESVLSLNKSMVWGEVNKSEFIKTVLKHVKAWINDINSFKPWCYWRTIRNNAITIGLQQIVIAFENQQIKPSDFIDVFNRNYYEEWVEKVTSEEKILTDFFSREFERKIEQFRDIDKRYMNLTKAEICARIASRLPKNAGFDSPNSEPGILRRQIQLQRRHMPVRALFQKIPNLLPRLKPCLLMSPISVAQYLDPKHPPFDIVIFDEASQIPVWDAVGAIARGTEVVIVGDPKQLPPTTFFSRVDDEGEEIDDNIVEDLESILDDCIAAQLPEQHLRWHYRSRHESLITFSNHHYYDNNLLTFPSPHQEMAVSFHFVEGVYDKGKSHTNRNEAETIVNEIIRRINDSKLSQYSIGVVTFSQAQQTLIEDLLEDARCKHPEIDNFFDSNRIEPIFVKNLENVQGDERDIILFSICYGPDAQGRVSMNFGPLNRKGGERRLNVAITRARHEVKVFSTLKANQIDLTKTRSEGVADLKCFLDYAERGYQAIAERIMMSSNEDCESPFEEQVCAKLREQGFEVHPQVGCSGYRIDLGVVDPEQPGRYILGIECDGRMYHSAKTARDRDRLREDILRDLGWEIHRIWSTDWWQNQIQELSRINVAIEKAKQNRTHNIENNQTTDNNIIFNEVSDIVIEDTNIVVAHDQPVAPIYQVIPVDRTLGDLEDFYLPSTNIKIKEILINVINYESPISIANAIRRVASYWGIKRVTGRIHSVIENNIKILNIKTSCIDGTVFLWSEEHNPQSYSIYRLPGITDEDKRNIEDIAPEEILNAILQIVEQQISLPIQDLIREASRLFGFSRTGQNVEKRIRSGIKLLIERKIVIEQDGNLVHQK